MMPAACAAFQLRDGPLAAEGGLRLLLDEEKQFPFIDVIPRQVFAAFRKSHLLTPGLFYT